MPQHASRRALTTNHNRTRRYRQFLAAVVAAIVLVTGMAVAPQAAVARGESTIWGATKPRGVALDSDRSAVTLGTKFTPAANGSATGIRFYKVAGMKGQHTGVLWSSTGQQLGTVKFTKETASGWQTAKFSKPVALKAGQSYTVAYKVPYGGRYGATVNHTGGSTTSSLKVTTKNSGVYTYVSRAAVPKQTWKSSQYWVDVTFLPTGVAGAKPVPPTEPKPTASATPKPTATATPKPTATATPTPKPTATATPTPKPTTTPTPAPAPPAASGAFPTATTAGLPAGWQPKKTVTGDYWIRTAGAVVEDLRISNGTIFVDAKNVTLRRIEGTNVRVFNYPGETCSTGLLVEDSTFRGSRSSDGQSVIGDGGYTTRNVVIDGASEGLRAGYAKECGGVTVDRTFIRITPPASCGDWHGDGIQGYTGGALTVRNSTIQFVERNGCNGTAAFFYPSGQGNTSVDINGLLVSGGGYPFRLGMPGKVANLNVVDGSWSYGPTEVNCGVVSSWQARVVKVDAAGQPVTVRSLACSGG